MLTINFSFVLKLTAFMFCAGALGLILNRKNILILFKVTRDRNWTYYLQIMRLTCNHYTSLVEYVETSKNNYQNFLPYIERKVEY